jgi:hypothetical protein
MADVEGSDSGVQEGGRSAWMRHVKKTMRSHKGMKLRAALELASKTFKKSKKSKRGGALTPASVGEGDGPTVPAGTAPVTGGRRRRSSRKTRKSRGSRKH